MSTGQTGREEAAAEALVAGVGAGLWYAMPDVVRSRTLRGVLKALMLVALVALSATRPTATGRRDGDDDRTATGRASGADLDRIREITGATPVLDGLDVWPQAQPGRAPSARQLAVIVGGGLAVAGGTAGTIAVERAILRLGERWRAQGMRAPHTRIGLVAGLLTGALAAVTPRVQD